jgi:SsrA-binding protein
MELSTNRKAHHDFAILEKYEVGIELLGTEVKSCRKRSISLQEGWIAIEKGQAWLMQVHISTYEQGNLNNHDPVRKRRLLMHKREILRLAAQMEQKGLTLVPLSFYLKHGLIKVCIGLAKGKNTVDKRQDMRKKDADMEIRKAMKR